MRRMSRAEEKRVLKFEASLSALGRFTSAIKRAEGCRKVIFRVFTISSVCREKSTQQYVKLCICHVVFVAGWEEKQSWAKHQFTDGSKIKAKNNHVKITSFLHNQPKLPARRQLLSSLSFISLASALAAIEKSWQWGWRGGRRHESE